jgi:DNA polymerase III delta prime subunit
MSEGEAEATGESASAGRRTVWTEQYRPRTLDEIAGHEEIVGRLESYVDENDLPHLLFSGPAGVGKCVVGETPVLTDRGIERIEEVVGEKEGFAAPDDERRVLTLDDGEFEYVEPSHVFSKAASELVAIETRDGADATVTPEHRLLVLTDAGLDWKRAERLEAGDRIARPLRAPLPETDDALDWVSAMDGERTLVDVSESFARENGIPAEEEYVGLKKRVFRRLRGGETVGTISRELDAPRKTIQQYHREAADIDLGETATTCSLSFIRDLGVDRETLREHVETIRHVTPQNRRSAPITPPWSVTPAVAAFVGLAVSEARIDGARIKFYNTDEGLLDRFGEAARTAFGVEPVAGEQKGVPYREIGNRTVTSFLGSCFDAFDGGTSEDAQGGGSGSALVRADEESRAAFLRAVFDAEGHVTEEGLELTQKDGDRITLLSYLLSGFGVPSRRTTKTKVATNGSGIEREYDTLLVSGARNLARFEERVGFGVEPKAARLATNAAREPNPNHDTMPAQAAVDELCRRLYLEKGELLTRALNPETPGRENHLEDVDRMLDAAAAKLETAQTVLERLDGHRGAIDAVSRVPAAWIGERAALAPLEMRRTVGEAAGVRTGRLLEYSDGRRTPTAGRAGEILAGIGAVDAEPPVERVQTELRDAIEALGVPYAHVAEGTELRGTAVINLLESDDHDLASLSRFERVAERVRTVAASMLDEATLRAIRTLDGLATTELYYDEVESIERVDEGRQVYDLTVPGSRNYVAGSVPTVMHNTTAATAIARELYGDEWRENFLELNASDERGIDVVRDRIKNFARASFGGYDYRIIFLDEADALTSDAQSALRRTMEQFSNNTRFVLSCNYSSRIIDPIQSRCAVFRFGPLSKEAIEARVREIAREEDITVADDGVAALVYAADGDMRKAINGLQAAATTRETVDEAAVYAITSTARPEEIEAMVAEALDGDFTAARAKLDELLTEQGLAGGDVIEQLHRSVWEFGLDDAAAVRTMERVGEADYRITAGASERVQLEALLASLALDDGTG